MSRFIQIIIVIFSFSYGSERGAELRTLEPVQYGKFEARYKPAQGEGLVSSFFVYNDDYPNTPWFEIDVELLGRFENVVDLNIITVSSRLRTHFTTLNTHLDYLIVGFEWTPDYIAFFINGAEVYRQTEEQVSYLDQSAKIMMNIWNPIWDDWVGFWDDRILPRFAYYDWVKYASYTPGSGNTGTDNNFTFEWQDDFNYYDSTRWEKSDNHTWASNQSIFIEENVVFNDGKLILCLTDDENIGYQDETIPYLLWARARGDSVIARFSEELDSVSSQNTNNFIISGASVHSAMLKPDKRTVRLTVNGMDLQNFYNLTILGINDDSQPPNTQLGQWLSIDMPEPLSFPLRVNNAGTAFDDFYADQLWSSSTEYGHMNGNYQITDLSIGNTDQDTLYISSLNRVVSYKVRVPNGKYSVTFKFSENHYSEPDQRTFDIFAEDSMWVSAIDIINLAGQFNAFDTTLNGITVMDGILDLYFSAVDYGSGYEYAGPFINSMVVEQDSTFDLGTFTDAQPHSNQVQFLQNYPNPFNQITTFNYFVNEPGMTEITIHNLNGQIISQIDKKYSLTGKHKVEWSFRGLSSGLYITRLLHNNNVITKKILFVK